jgi:hypothetical protein
MVEPSTEAPFVIRKFVQAPAGRACTAIRERTRRATMKTSLMKKYLRLWCKGPDTAAAIVPYLAVR